MTITLSGIEYTITKCSAVALCDLEDGSRQEALLVRHTNEFGENIEAVVFGFNMPEDADDLAAMFEEPYAWEFDYEVINTII